MILYLKVHLESDNNDTADSLKGSQSEQSKHNSPFFQASPVPATGNITPLTTEVDAERANSVSFANSQEGEGQTRVDDDTDKDDDDVSDLLGGESSEEEFKTHGQTKFRDSPINNNADRSFILSVSPISSPDAVSSPEHQENI